MRDNKICVISAYFGKVPNYFPLWLKSCENNPEVDFLFVTDDVIAEHPSNVIVHKTTLEAVKSKASEILGFEASLERPYKMCDYKPMYGVLFADMLSQYDYWGHCDIDLIFGDLQHYFEKYDLYRYDRFLPLGHLSLYKNSEEINNRYKSELLINNYIEVFSNDKSYIFDEIGGMTPFYANSSYPFFKKRVFADIASIYERYRLIEEYIYDEKPKNYPKQIFLWENGKCYREWMIGGKLFKEEYIYVHFKKRPNFKVEFDVKAVDAFYITKFGFVPKAQITDQEIIQKLNPYEGKLHEFKEFARFKSLKYIRKLKGKIKRGIQTD